jgi:type I restriction enzyme S subunit
VSKREESFSIGKDSVSLESLCREPPYRYPTFYGLRFVKVGIPVLKISNMTLDGKLPTDTALYDHITAEDNSRFPKTIVKENDLIMEVRGTYIGKTALVPNELSGANISPNTIRIAPDENQIIPEYVWHYTFTSWWQNQIERITRRWKVGFGTVRADRLKLVRVPAPSKEAQKAVLSQLKRIDRVISEFSQSIETCDALLQTLLERHYGSAT